MNICKWELIQHLFFFFFTQKGTYVEKQVIKEMKTYTFYAGDVEHITKKTLYIMNLVC